MHFCVRTSTEIDNNLSRIQSRYRSVLLSFRKRRGEVSTKISERATPKAFVSRHSTSNSITTIILQPSRFSQILYRKSILLCHPVIDRRLSSCEVVMHGLPAPREV